jgi:hypothetical protein
MTRSIRTTRKSKASQCIDLFHVDESSEDARAIRLSLSQHRSVAKSRRKVKTPRLFSGGGNRRYVVAAMHLLRNAARSDDTVGGEQRPSLPSKTKPVSNQHRPEHSPGEKAVTSRALRRCCLGFSRNRKFSTLIVPLSVTLVHTVKNMRRTQVSIYLLAGRQNPPRRFASSEMKCARPDRELKSSASR